MRKFLPLVLALVLMAPLSIVPSAVRAMDVGSVTTNDATNLLCASATLNLSIAPGTACTCYTVYFEYGTSLNDYTVSTSQRQLCQRPYTFSADITGLKPCQTYYVRAVAICDGQGRPVTIYGNVITFDTMKCCAPPSTSHGSGWTMGTTIRPYLPPLFEVQNATVAAAKAGPGEQVEVTATVTNKGGSNGSTKIILYVNGQEADSKGVALASGQSTPVSFKVSRNDPGTYSVYVNGVSAGSFTVDLFTSNDILIYCSVALFVIGMIGLLYYLNKRRTAA